VTDWEAERVTTREGDWGGELNILLPVPFPPSSRPYSYLPVNSSQVKIMEESFIYVQTFKYL